MTTPAEKKALKRENQNLADATRRARHLAAQIVDAVNETVLANDLPVPTARFENAVERVLELLPSTMPAEDHRAWLQRVLHAGEAAFKKHEPRTSRNRFAFLYAWVQSAADGEGAE